MEIFISYSHKDVVWKDRVAVFMQCMKQHEKLEYSTWDDGDITPSKNWKDSIKEAINKAKVAILLVSSDFLSSKFIIEQEKEWLLERKDKGELAIIPVIVRPCPWEVTTWLAPIQKFPSEGSALSSLDEHIIEENLTNIAVLASRLINDADSEPESTDSNEVDVQTSPDGYKFLDEKSVKDIIAERRGRPVLDTLLIFRTKKQRTWLVTTSKRLHCILDSQRTLDSDRLIQWEMTLEPQIQVHVRPRSRLSFAGLIDIGKRQNWYYNRNLFPDPKKLERKILKILNNARHN